MQIRKCTISDAAELAVLNKQLIDDEKSDNPMTLCELENRMKDFLSSDYTAYLFVEDNLKIGYALVKNNSDPIYLRQFLIDRAYRGRHYGKKAFQMLLRHLGTQKIDIEVLPWNRSGYAFWKSCGFKEISIAMRYED